MQTDTLTNIVQKILYIIPNHVHVHSVKTVTLTIQTDNPILFISIDSVSLLHLICFTHLIHMRHLSV